MWSKEDEKQEEEEEEEHKETDIGNNKARIMV